MYRREILSIPTFISRSDFIDCIFDFSLSAYTKYIAVCLAERFIAQPNIIYYISCTHQSDPHRINGIPCERRYSRELANVVLAIASGHQEDGFDFWMALDNYPNRYMIKLHWEVCISNEFTISRNNFLEILYYHQPEAKFPEIFYQKLLYDICSIPNILDIQPLTIIMAILLLLKRGKLRALKHQQEYIREYVILRIAKYTNTDFSDLCDIVDLTPRHY